MLDCELLKSVFDSLSNVGVVVCDRQGVLLFFNPEAERILGVGIRETGPADWTRTFGCYLPDMCTPVPSQQLPLARALRGAEVTQELVFIRNTQQAEGVWINTTAKPLRDATGAIHGAVAVLRDVTEAQQVLRNRVDGNSSTGTAGSATTGSEWAAFVECLDEYRGHYDRLCIAVEQTADTVLITDTRGVIEYVNPAFEATTGYTADEALGRTPSILKSGHHDAQFYRHLWDQLLAGKPFRGTIVNRKKSGELYWAEQTITPMKNGSGQITHFVSVLRDVTERRKQQKQEMFLELARVVQQRFYSTAACLPGFDIAGVAHPALLTGGDYFDFIPQADGGLCVVVGDVSGHGFGAALLMAETRAYLRCHAREESDVGSVLNNLNPVLAADFEEGNYVTLVLIRLDPKNRSFQYSSAGHIPCYLLRAKGEVGHVIRSSGPPLGLFPCSQYHSSPVMQLDDEDTIVLLTDGATEARRGDGEEFGSDRVLEFARCHLRNSAQELVEGVCEAVKSFAFEEPQADDITLVVCKVRSNQSAPLSESVISREPKKDLKRECLDV